MTQDTSPNYEQTKAFLDRRLRDVGKIGQTRAALEQWSQFGVESLSSLLVGGFKK